MNADLQYLDFQIRVFFDWPEGVRYKVVPKGRRTGITKGAANAFIEDLLDGQGPLLWGDTIHPNIDRYFQRYFLPELKSNNIKFQWESQKKQLTVNDNFCDFRSADNPENWEGFGYKKIFLNEAGIILKDPTLYTETVLPMLLDFPDSKLIAAGVPKGKTLKNGKEHPFFTLYKKAKAGNRRYQLIQLTSYDNPIINPADIQELEDEIASVGNANTAKQEIHGEFVDVDADNPFAHQFDPEYHVSEKAIFSLQKQLYISIDFNINPFAVTFWHYWQDSEGHHLWGIDEAEIKMGNIPSMIQLIKERYRTSLYNAVLTGDSMGNNRDIGRVDNASHYMELLKGLNMSERQLKVPKNPTHLNSRADVNTVLWESKKENSKFEVLLHPKKMVNTIRDFTMVQCNAEGQILKRDRKDINQRADFLDCGRSVFNLLFKEILMTYRGI